MPVFDDEDEILDAGPRRRLPRWTTPAVLVLVAMVVAGVLLARHQHSSPQAAPKSSPVPSGTHVLDATTGADVSKQVAAVIADSHAGRVYSLTRDGTFLVRNVDGSDPVTAFASLIDGVRHPLLAVDAPHHLLWVVTAGGGDEGSTVESLDTFDYSAATQIVIPGSVDGMAVLDGRVYLASGNLILLIRGADQVPKPVASLRGRVSSLVADPTRHRLLIYDAARQNVQAWSPRHGLGPFAGTLATEGRLAVVDGVVWLVGRGATGPLLGRLDATTLEAEIPDVPPDGLAAGAVLEGTGDHSLYVGTTASPKPLWCIGAVNADVRMRWPSVPRPFVSVKGQGYTVGYGTLQPVPMGACPG